MSSGDFTRFHEWGKKIVGVGINYREMAEQVGEKLPSEPLIFFKPTTSYITEGQNIQVSELNKQGLWYEVELGIVIGKRCKQVTQSDIMDYIAGYCVVLDMTCPESFFNARKQVLPWSIAKGFDTSTPIGHFVPKTSVNNPQNLRLWLKLNGKIRQNANTKDMNFSIPHIISFMSQHFTLEAGDLVLTGTPGGVGTTDVGDVIEAGIENLGTVLYKVGSSADSENPSLAIFP